MKDEREQDPVPENGGESAAEKADELFEVARRRGRGLLDRQKDAAGEELHSVADVMREAAHKFEERQEGGVAAYVEKAAGALDRVSSTLREKNLEELMVEAQDELRKRPAVVLGATAIVGFALGRFLRAGSQRIARRKREGAADEESAH